MGFRNKEYGKPKQCEYDNCENTRGAPLRSKQTYGCVLCVFHEDQYQLGEIELPETASEQRKQDATDRVLS